MTPSMYIFGKILVVLIICMISNSIIDETEIRESLSVKKFVVVCCISILIVFAPVKIMSEILTRLNFSLYVDNKESHVSASVT